MTENKSTARPTPAKVGTAKAAAEPKAPEVNPETQVAPAPVVPEGTQNPAQEPAATPTGADGTPEGANGPQEGTSQPDGPKDVTTKSLTFAQAAEVIAPVQAPAGVLVTNTERLAAEGKSKGLTFAEQAEQAAALYGSGNPADRA